MPIIVVTRAMLMSCERASADAASFSASVLNARIIPTMVPSIPQIGPVNSATPIPAIHRLRCFGAVVSVANSLLGGVYGEASISWHNVEVLSHLPEGEASTVG